MSDNVLKTERCELKYYVSLSDVLLLRERLAAVLSRDANSPLGGYRVKSLYFDSLNDVLYEANGKK